MGSIRGRAVMVIIGRQRGGMGTGGIAALTLLVGWGASQSQAAVPGAVPAAGPATAGTPGCTAVAQVQSQWGEGTSWGGEVLTVTVRNSSSRRSTRWQVSWTLGAGQQLQGSWGAQVHASGSAITATNAAYNGPLQPSGTATFGVNLSGTAAAPTLRCSSDTDQGGDGTTRTVTAADDGSTVQLGAGDRLTVSLGADYLPPTVSGSALALVSSSGGYPTGEPVSATFRVVGTGTAELRSQTDYLCFHQEPHCARPTQSWTVHVVAWQTTPTPLT